VSRLSQLGIMQPLFISCVYSVLYERLAQLPPAEPHAHEEHAAPPPVAQPYPPTHASMHMPREQPVQLSQRDLEFQEYLRANPNGEVSVVPGPDGRPIPVIQGGHGHAFVHQSSRHGPLLPDDRALPPLTAMSPGRRHASAHGHGHPYAPMHSAAAAQIPVRGRPTSSHSQSSRLSPPPGYPPQMSVQSYSTHPVSSSRSARPTSPGGYASASHRTHNHQRIGPGANLNLDEWERQREERYREHEHEREQERAYAARHVMPAADYSRRRSVDENMHYAESRTVGPTGRADGEPPYRSSPRPYTGPNLDDDDVPGPSSNSRIPYSEDLRGPPPAAPESRKRPRTDAETNGDDRPPVAPAPPPVHTEDDERVGKRAHTESEGAESRPTSREPQEEEAMEAD
jgi:hypothetical protein